LSKNITNSAHFSSGDGETFLLHRLAEGNAEAYATLYKRYQPKLSRFLYPFRNVEDPREIIQDIFMKNLGKAGSHDSHSLL